MSLVAELHNAHKARVAAIAAKAAEHEASKKSTLIAELKQCCEPKPEPKPAPEPIEDGWVERQTSSEHRKLWFTIVRSIKLNRLGGPPIKEIQRATCEVYGVTMDDLLSERCTANVVLPRHVSIYLAKELTTLSWPRIGRATGGRDHSTAISAHRKIERLLKSDEKLAGQIAAIRERLA